MLSFLTILGFFYNISPERLIYLAITLLGGIIIKWYFNNILTAKHLGISLLKKNKSLPSWFPSWFTMENKLGSLHYCIMPEQSVAKTVGRRFNGRFSVTVPNTIAWSNEPTKWPTTFLNVVYLFILIKRYTI